MPTELSSLIAQKGAFRPRELSPAQPSRHIKSSMGFRLALSVLLLSACSSNEPGEAPPECPEGARTCACRPPADGTACDAGLSCDGTLGCVRVCEGFRDVNTREDWDTLVAEDCDVVSGYLTILGTEFEPPLVNLTGLDSLKRVGEHLSIYYHDALVDFSGLENLTSVGDYVYLSGNRSLESLRGLDNLSHVGADFSVTNHISLQSLHGLEALTEVESYLEIGYNLALTSLEGLENLTALGGDLNIEHSGVTSLAPIHDWSPDAVAGELRIHDNTALPACEVTRLDDHLDANCPTEGPFQCIGNDGDGACP